MKITNADDLPEALVEQVSIRQRKPGRLSATTLIKGTKHILLEERHWDELEEDVADQLFALFGSAVHKLLEKAGVDEFTEEYLEYELDGVMITGMVDNYNKYFIYNGLLCFSMYYNIRKNIMFILLCFTLFYAI